MTPAPTKPSEALRAARELLSDRKRWIKGDLALNAEGDSVFWGFDPQAVCWCSIGAIEHAIGRDDYQVRRSSIDFLAYAVDKFVPDWNDAKRRKHAEIIEGFTKAIALAEEAGQ